MSNELNPEPSDPLTERRFRAADMRIRTAIAAALPTLEPGKEEMFEVLLDGQLHSPHEAAEYAHSRVLVFEADIPRTIKRFDLRLFLDPALAVITLERSHGVMGLLYE